MDDQFKQTGYTRNRKLKHLTRSKSFDDLVLTKTYKNNRSDQSHHVSDTTRTILDLSLLGDEERYRNGESDDEKTDEHIHFDLHRARTRQRSRSAPISPTLVDDQEFAAFIQCEQQQQQTTTDSFVYNMDLSDSIESSHQPKSRTSIFDDDDFLPEPVAYVPSTVHIIHTNLLNSCLTITEENEEELEQLRRDDDEQRKREEEEEQCRMHHYMKIHDEYEPTITLHDSDDRADILENEDELGNRIMANLSTISLEKDSYTDNERLSTIYESPIGSPYVDEREQDQEEEDIYDDAYDKLIVYDIVEATTPEKVHPIKIQDEIFVRNNNEQKPIFIQIPIKPKTAKPAIDRPIHLEILNLHPSSTIDKSRLRSCYNDATPVLSPSYSNQLSASNLCGTTTTITSKVFTPSSSSSTTTTFTHRPSSNDNDDKCSSSPVINLTSFPTNPSMNSLPVQAISPTRPSPMSLSVPMLLLSTNHQSNTCKTKQDESFQSEQSCEQSTKMKANQTSSSSLSDFILPKTKSPTFKTNSSQYEEVPSVHHSLNDCSLIQQMSCCSTTGRQIDDEHSDEQNFFNPTQRRPSFTRRILTNGLLLSHCTSNANHRRASTTAATSRGPITCISPDQHSRIQIKQKSEEKLSSFSSPISSPTSSKSNSPTGDKLMSRSDFRLQQADQMTQQRKSSSLKNVRGSSIESASRIVYPIDFETNHHDQIWLQKRCSSHENKVPTSDSGIVIDTAGTRPTSKSSIDENDGDAFPTDSITNSSILQQYQYNYRQALSDLTLIKKNIVEIESRLAEAMRELEIERALVEGEHELVFKQILDASEQDQEKLRLLYDNLQLLIDRIMSEKSTIRREIDYVQDVLFKLEDELQELEQEYRPSDDKILKKRETIIEARKRQEDLEFQLMELETRYEAELEQAELNFQNERICANQNAKIRQNTLRDLDQQQQLILQQATLEKEKLEREKLKLKILFKQKKMEANELEQKINQLTSNQEKHFPMPTNVNGHQGLSVIRKDHRFNGQDISIYHSTPTNLYSSLNHQESFTIKTPTKSEQQEKLNDMGTANKLEKMALLEQQFRERYNDLIQCHDEQIKRVEFEDQCLNDIPNQDYSNERQVKLRDKNRLQERPLTRYLPVRSVDFDLRSHIEAAGHFVDSPHIQLTPTSCRGFLQKMGGMKFKTWNRRWFVFDRKRRSLCYYQDKSETKLRGCIYFQSIVEVYVDHVQSMSLRSPEPREATFIVKTFERPFYLVAPTVEAMRIWVDVLITGAEGNSFAGDA